ncbi:MAG: [FeFe] hydrogenase, group A [Lachnospiraceae bacterium]|nr:[FeFe] hydrogenase, group A [Lachnospiraceae bacterium]
METVNIKINGIDVAAPKNSTILEAAKLANIDIPTLCYLKDINEIGACRMCVVEVKGARGLAAACVYPVNEGMEVFTNTPKVLDYRKTTLKLILSDHKMSCLSCVRSGNCELLELCRDLGVEATDEYAGVKNQFELDTTAVHMIRDNEKCILCRRCSAVCEKVQGIGVIGANERGFATEMTSPFGLGLATTSCVNCGQCIAVCPVGAIYEKTAADEVLAAINNPEKHVVVQAAPAVRAALGEEFGYEIGTNVQGKLAAALRRIGFEKVFDTNFSADLTIMEESNELLERIEKGGKLPLITSCSPGWINYCEHYFPELTENLSSCKSPQQMFGAVAKTYYAEKMGWDPKDVVCVSIMPCTAKKGELARDDQNAAGVQDVDYSMTTRELARLIKRMGIDFKALPDEGFDSPLGSGTGAAVIFGVTGGVMEAALRTAVWKLTGEKDGTPIEFKEVRGMEGIKEATYEVAGLKVNVAVASGLANANKLLRKIESGEANYQFVEIMGCPGGCVNGGGQPQVHARIRNFTDIRAERGKALYSIDEKNTLRFSHENPDVQALYKEYLEKPGSHKAHEILHTTYVKKKVHDYKI